MNRFKHLSRLVVSMYEAFEDQIANISMLTPFAPFVQQLILYHVGDERCRDIIRNTLPRKTKIGKGHLESATHLDVVSILLNCNLNMLPPVSFWYFLYFFLLVVIHLSLPCYNYGP